MQINKMEDDKPAKKVDISKSKNVVQDSNIQGENIHIGDIIHHYSGGKEENPRQDNNTAQEEVRQLIGRGKIDNAIELLLDWANAKKDEETADELHVISRQWQGLRKQERIGVISSSEATIQTNRIAYALLQIIRQA